MSHTPVPYQLCCCGICRKLSGYSGCVQLGADYNTLNITQGKDDIRVYNAVCDRDTDKEKTLHSERSFCGKCSSMFISVFFFSAAWSIFIRHLEASALPVAFILRMRDSQTTNIIFELFAAMLWVSLQAHLCTKNSIWKRGDLLIDMLNVAKKKKKLWDKLWPDLCHPFAAAIDSDLKEPEKMVRHIFHT